MTQSDDDIIYYSKLERGARYLASISADQAERDTHLAMANRYNHLGRSAADWNAA
jgi:hypothetical protein